MTLWNDLVDAVDKGPVTIERDEAGQLRSIASQARAYRVTNGHPNMIPEPLPEPLRDRQELWTTLQANGNRFYEASPSLNLSTDDAFVADFTSVADLRGSILDIGCGPQQHAPRYLTGETISEVVGLDPLIGSPARDFAFIIGISEALPFATARFDRVVFCRSLDHVLDTEMALVEAFRVLKPGGHLYIVMDLEQKAQGFLARAWHLLGRGIGQLRKDAKENGLLHALAYSASIARLKTPDGAEDMFHMHFPTVEEVQDILQRAGAASVRFHDLSADETICIAEKPQ